MRKLQYFSDEISKIEREIRALNERKQFFEEVNRIGLLVSTADEDRIIRDKKSRGKYLTLYRVAEYFVRSQSPPKTKNILNYLRMAFSDNRNETTLRSHLRRLKEEGHLMYDEHTRSWGLP